MSGDSRRIVGAANPRALAQLRAGRTIDWSAEEDGGAKLIAQLLDMPLSKIVDPKHGSPILDDSGELGQRALDVAGRRCLRTRDPHVPRVLHGIRRRVLELETRGASPSTR